MCQNDDAPNTYLLLQTITSDQKYSLTGKAVEGHLSKTVYLTAAS